MKFNWRPRYKCKHIEIPDYRQAKKYTKDNIVDNGAEHAKCVHAE